MSLGNLFLNAGLGLLGHHGTVDDTSQADYATVHGTPEHVNVWGSPPTDVQGNVMGRDGLGNVPTDIWGRRIG